MSERDEGIGHDVDEKPSAGYQTAPVRETGAVRPHVSDEELQHWATTHVYHAAPSVQAQNRYQHQASHLADVQMERSAVDRTNQVGKALAYREHQTSANHRERGLSLGEQQAPTA